MLSLEKYSELELKAKVHETVSRFQEDVIRHITYKQDGVQPKGRDYRESNSYRKGRFPYIPNSNYCFTDMLKKALKLKPESETFLDVGCGIGVKVAIAANFGFKAQGLEINDFLLELANAGNSWDKRYFKANALTYKHYDNYDVIYMYEPLCNQKQREILFKRIVQQMKVGSLLLYSALWQVSHPLLKRYDYHPVWEKING